ncbi:MAG: ROK family transcriptional regulator [Athalassotoga sp.]
MDVINEVRVKNTIKVLDLIMRHGEISRVDLAREMDLTKTTISDIVSNLIEKGFVREKRRVTSGLGRPQTMIEMIPEVLYVVGIGVMRDRTEACVVNSQGTILKQSSRILNDNANGQDIFDNLFSLIDEIKTFVNINAISVGIPGPLDVENGIVKKPPKFPDFENVNLTKILSEKYNVDVWIENDSDLAAFGEKWYGNGRQLDDFIYLFVDKGIGAGIIKDGNIYHGKNGYAGEIGHLLFPVKDEFKYLEDICGIDVVIQKANENSSGKEMTIQEIGRKYISGDKEISDLIDEMERYIGIALVSIIHMFGISDIFVGGKAVYLGDKFLSNVKAFVEKYLFYKHEISIRFSNLGDSAMSMGAAVNGIRKYIEKSVIKMQM